MIAFVLSVMFAFITSSFLAALQPATVVAFGLGITALFWGYRISWKNILAAFILIGLLLFSYPILMTYAKL